MHNYIETLLLFAKKHNVVQLRSCNFVFQFTQLMFSHKTDQNIFSLTQSCCTGNPLVCTIWNSWYSSTCNIQPPLNPNQSDLTAHLTNHPSLVTKMSWWPTSGNIITHLPRMCTDKVAAMAEKLNKLCQNPWIFIVHCADFVYFF